MADMPVMIKIHSTLMLWAWAFCSTNGFIMSRHGKGMDMGFYAPGRRMDWFKAHMMFNSLAVILTFIGVCLAVSDVHGYSLHTFAPVGAHPICGFTVATLAIANPLISLLRCNPYESKRFIFNWVHFVVGIGAQTIAVPTITLGLIRQWQQTETQVARWLMWTYLVFVTITVIFEITFEILSYGKMFAHLGQVMRVEPEVVSRSYTFAQMIRVAYITFYIVSLGFTVAMTIMTIMA